MSCELDRVIDRCGTDSAKWCVYPQGTLPLWVADMDFAAPEPVVRALRVRVDHGVFGYGVEPPALRQVIVDRLQNLYGWRVSPEALVFLPGVVAGFNMACRAFTRPGDGVLVQTPAYPPILRAPANAHCTLDGLELTRGEDGHYEIDLDAMERTITGRTRVFILCNPHNPVGRVFTHAELKGMANLCLKHNVIICSDEIHCDFVYRGSRHIPIASLDKEIEQRTITLIAPSKTYNMPGLHLAVAVVPNSELREGLCSASRGLIMEPDVLSYTAALAAYRDGQEWLDQVLGYLEVNRDLTFAYVQNHLPGISMSKAEGTYLAWLDCRQLPIREDTQQFFLQQARVALNDGPDYGPGGQGFVRLNFGCPRVTLREALRRMGEAVLTV